MREILEKLLCSVDKDYKNTAACLCRSFPDIPSIAQAKNEAILAAVSGNMSTALYIKLAFAVAERRYLERFKMKKKYTDREIANYLRAILFNKSEENVIILSFDGSGKLLGYDTVGTGTVNQSLIIPRQVIEIAKARSAKQVIIAHNHPSGLPASSEADRLTTFQLADALKSAGICLTHHYIVAGESCRGIPIPALD